MTTNQKLYIGAAAAATTIVAGIAIWKHRPSKKLKAALKEFDHRYNVWNERVDRMYNNTREIIQIVNESNLPKDMKKKFQTNVDTIIENVKKALNEFRNEIFELNSVQEILDAAKTMDGQLNNVEIMFVCMNTWKTDLEHLDLFVSNFIKNEEE